MVENQRMAQISRDTSETKIKLELNIDGSGSSKTDTGIPFFDHMLTLFARHGFFDLQVEAKGDLEVDQHHTVEDVGICLGQALDKALGDKKGIKRYGDCMTPMDESLSRIALDIGGRPQLFCNIELSQELISDFDPNLVNEFLVAVVNQAGLTLHVDLIKRGNNHHAIEAVFKGLGRALDKATSLDIRRKDIPSTKGKI